MPSRLRIAWFSVCIKESYSGPHDGFGTADWDLQRMRAAERAMIMRNQGFIHPATLVPDELEYKKGYEAEDDRTE